MPKRGPTDTDRTTPPADGDVEVVNAAGERKPASLPKRLLDATRDLVSMTDEQRDLADPGWQPGELADDPADATLVVGNGDVAPERVKYMDEKPHAFKGNPPRYCEVCNLPERDPIHADDRPPSNVLATYRSQHAANTAAAVDESARKVGQLVGLDRRARHYAYDVQHLIGIHAICAKAIDQLADHDLVSSALIRELVAEVAGWQQDREVGS
jgi:hypothetical protein